ncbi:MAG: hypothetical protein N2376_05195, partial [Clostridia bacterium]|nr:hypothetical protein [Clostridia bacterium]
MDYVRKLPLLLGLSAAIIVGLASYTNKVSNSENTVNMLIAMVTFYIVGTLIRNTITSIIETNRRKQEEKELEEKRLEELKQKEEERQRKEAEKNKGRSVAVSYTHLRA